MSAEHTELDGGLWLSITELARRKGVKKATISERVARLVERGLIEIRPGKGKQKLVNVAQYDTAIGETGDAAKEAAAETRGDAPPSQPPRFRDAQTREKEYQADLAFIKLERERGNLLPVEDVREAAEEAAMAIGDLFAELPVRIASALGRELESAETIRLKTAIRELQAATADAMQKIAESATALALPPEHVAPVQAELPIPEH